MATPLPVEDEEGGVQQFYFRVLMRAAAVGADKRWLVSSLVVRARVCCLLLPGETLRLGLASVGQSQCQGRRVQTRACALGAPESPALAVTAHLQTSETHKSLMTSLYTVCLE